MLYFDPLYILLALPGLILALLASFYVKSTFARYSRLRPRNGMSGAEAAAEMLRRSGVDFVRIERAQGFLSDHYDPSAKVLRLSPDVYDKSSLSAIGVACHEAGHALQDAQSYYWLGLRSSLVPVASLGSNLSYLVFFLGLFMGSMGLVKLGILMFAMAVLFTIVTLPVEWNASARAKQAMIDYGIVSHQEGAAAAAVLNAAFMTYVAAAISAILTLLYYLMRSGLLGGRRD
ncbi:MAG: zinc metallopeptidase [Lentisphaeria bacterium]|jgi:Zn-dependent membrane protease YugP|nr:zinc metallopeptidase [Lentisphaeria bacterium]MDY0175442.1 zinc metallopeptidase [Lentisphaeria bacterium]NLZ59153.1 zinc metallopeptidase [Lentisphaerota bacterium]